MVWGDIKLRFVGVVAFLCQTVILFCSGFESVQPFHPQPKSKLSFQIRNYP